MNNPTTPEYHKPAPEGDLRIRKPRTGGHAWRVSDGERHPVTVRAIVAVTDPSELAAPWETTTLADLVDSL